MAIVSIDHIKANHIKVNQIKVECMPCKLVPVRQQLHKSKALHCASSAVMACNRITSFNAISSHSVSNMSIVVSGQSNCLYRHSPMRLRVCLHVRNTIIPDLSSIVSLNVRVSHNAFVPVNWESSVLAAYFHVRCQQLVFTAAPFCQ